MKNKKHSQQTSKTHLLLGILSALLVLGSAAAASAEEDGSYQASGQSSEHGANGEDCGCCCGHGMMGMHGKEGREGPPHSSGPYLRGGFGVGFSSHGLVDDGDLVGQYTGASINYELAFGKFIAKNTALHLSFFGNTMPKPIERTGPIDGDASNGFKNYPTGGEAERFGLMAGGIGLTNYIGQSGLMFSVTPAAARLRARFDNGGFAVTGETDWGFAFDSLFGYEWRTSEHSSVGMGVSGGMYIIPDGDIDPARRGYNVGGRFFFAWD